MNKKIIFSLLLIATTTLSHGMEKIVCDKHCDEKALKKEIDAYADAHEESHLYAAKWLMKTHYCCIPIYEKIDHLFDIAHDPNQQFTEEDLNDPWYVNATETWKFKPYVNMRSHEKKSTLLTIAYGANENVIQVHKIKDLLHAKADVKNDINNNLLNQICHDRKNRIKDEQTLLSTIENIKNMSTPGEINYIALLKPMMDIEIAKLHLTQLLTFAELLLQLGTDPNFRLLKQEYTPLMTAVTNSDPEYAHLLLWYNADPCNIVIRKVYFKDDSYETTYNAFDLEKTGWLKKMIRDKQQTIFKCLLFKHHNGELKLLPEIVDFIRYKIWEIGKNSFKTTQSQIDQSERQ